MSRGVGVFRRPGGEFLFRVEKEPKDARGQTQLGTSCPDSSAPWTPFYGAAN